MKKVIFGLIFHLLQCNNNYNNNNLYSSSFFFILLLFILFSGPQIGEGQFSRVFLGKYFGDYVAIKKQIRQDKVLDCYLLRELAVLKNASHENLVGYIGACNEVASNQSKVNALYIVTEFCQVYYYYLLLLYFVYYNLI